MTAIATMRTLDETHGAVRVEDLYDTDIGDLWQACTTPERLARWIALVDGDMRVGDTIQAVFTSSWTGPARIEVCDAPHHLMLRTEPDSTKPNEPTCSTWPAPSAGRAEPPAEAAPRTCERASSGSSTCSAPRRTRAQGAATSSP